MIGASQFVAWTKSTRDLSQPITAEFSLELLICLKLRQHSSIGYDKSQDLASIL